MNAFPGSIFLSPADACSAYFLHIRHHHKSYVDVTLAGEILPRLLKPAVWLTPHGYTYNVSLTAYEANQRTGWKLVQLIETDDH